MGGGGDFIVRTSIKYMVRVTGDFIILPERI